MHDKRLSHTAIEHITMAHEEFIADKKYK